MKWPVRNEKAIICFQKLVKPFFFQLPPIALLTKGMPQAQNPHSLVASVAVGNRNKKKDSMNAYKDIENIEIQAIVKTVLPF